MIAAFIPVRGGSKSIPLKNIRELCKRPLVYWTVAAACGCKSIDVVYVATDSDVIRHTVDKFRESDEIEGAEKIRVISRSAESASDTASTEFAMLEFAGQYSFDHLVLIQATSPLLRTEDLDRGFALFQEEGTDSVLSVVRQKRFHWTVDKEGTASPANYDVFHRPRRQEFEGYFVENGAFYITSKELLLHSQNRISGRIKACEMPEENFYEIDEPEDWIIIEQLLKKRLLKERQMKDRSEIKMFLTDCDGCLTDGGMYYSEAGDELKKFCTQDGMGFALLKKRGIFCGIITGESTELVKRRAEKLKLDILELGVQDKLAVVKRLCREYGIELRQVAYMGDDINDIEVLKKAGISFSVPNAVRDVHQYADIITKRRGGDGAVREAVDYILEECL